MMPASKTYADRMRRRSRERAAAVAQPTEPEGPEPIVIRDASGVVIRVIQP